MIFSKKTHEGYLFVDHRASPGIPREMCERMGLDPHTYAGSKIAEYATLGCEHCGAHVVINPLRTRERAWCSQCDRYICDGCNIARQEPGYVHRTIKVCYDLALTEKWEVSGRACRPTITRR